MPSAMYGPPAADFFEPTSYADFQRSIDDPPGYRNWWSAEQLPELSDAAIEAVTSLSEQMPGENSQVFIVPWGGAGALGARPTARWPAATRPWSCTRC